MSEDITPEAVARYDIEQPDRNMGYATMKAFEYGDWVRYEDHAARIAELETENKRAWKEADAWGVKCAWAIKDKLAAEAEVARLREAIRYVLDGYGLNEPDFERQPEDDEDDWIVTRLRAALQEPKP